MEITSYLRYAFHTIPQLAIKTTNASSQEALIQSTNDTVVGSYSARQRRFLSGYADASGALEGSGSYSDDQRLFLRGYADASGHL